MSGTETGTAWALASWAWGAIKSNAAWIVRPWTLGRDIDALKKEFADMANTDVVEKAKKIRDEFDYKPVGQVLKEVHKDTGVLHGYVCRQCFQNEHKIYYLRDAGLYDGEKKNHPFRFRCMHCQTNFPTPKDLDSKQE